MSKLNNKISTGLEYKNYFNPKFIINVERSTGCFPISLFHINIILKKQSPGGGDEIVGPDDMDSENFPSEKSMERWHHWSIFNRMNMEGHIRSSGHRILGYDEELLSSTMSLLSHIRSSIPDIWLKIILRYFIIREIQCRLFTDFELHVRKQ